jgi:hypothetical protein
MKNSPGLKLNIPNLITAVWLGLSCGIVWLLWTYGCWRGRCTWSWFPPCGCCCFISSGRNTCFRVSRNAGRHRMMVILSGRMENISSDNLYLGHSGRRGDFLPGLEGGFQSFRVAADFAAVFNSGKCQQAGVFDVQAYEE